MFSLYKREWQIFRQQYARLFIWILAICVLSTLLSYVALVKQPDLAIEMTQKLGEQLQRQVENFGGTLEGSYGELFFIILKNNLYVSTVVFLLGFIPVVILPLFSPFVTMLSIGIMLAGIKVQGESPLQVLILGILPHGIVEIAAIVLSCSLGCYISIQIVKKIFSRHRNDIPLLKLIGRTLRTFVLVVVPMIILAALIEGFVTPMLLGLKY